MSNNLGQFALPQARLMPLVQITGAQIDCFVNEIRRPAYISDASKKLLFNRACVRCRLDLEPEFDISTRERKECIVNLIRQNVDFWETLYQCTQRGKIPLWRLRLAGMDKTSDNLGWLWPIVGLALVLLLWKD